jgi:AP endonuclease-2
MMAPPSNNTLTIVTWNCNGIASGLGANVKYEPEKTLGAWLRSRLGADVVAMQETKLAASKIPRELAVVDGYESFWASSLDKTGYSGVVTYAASPPWSPVDAKAPLLLFSSSSPSSSSPPSDPLDREGRVVETDFGPDAFVFINVYAPNAGHGSRQRPVEGGGAAAAGENEDEPHAAAVGNGGTGGAPTLSRRAEKLRFLRRLTQRVKELHAQGRSVILVGDLNVAVRDADVSSLIGPIADVYSREERAAFGELLRELPDVWRAFHPVAGEEEREEAAARGGGGHEKKKPPKPPAPSSSSAPSSTPSCFTVWDERTSARAFDRGLRIDYVLVSPRLLPLVASTEILGKDVIPQKWSDHAAVKVVLRLPKQEQEGGKQGATAAGGGGGDRSSSPPPPVVRLAPPAPHPPCRASSLVDERWALRPKGQKSISSFFSAAAKRPKEGEGGGGAAGAGAAGAAAGGGEPAAKKHK